MFKLGLIGKELSHSFSKKYFDRKFKNENIYNYYYDLYDLDNLNQLETLINQHKIVGLNVTRPYKKKIIQYLDELDDISKKIGSVNTIFINHKTNQKIGFNTDAIGFEALLLDLRLNKHIKGLILGSGGVSNTVSYIFKKYQIRHKIVSRKPNSEMLHYSELDNVIHKFQLIINTTPLGQYPHINSFPKIPYSLITNKQICIDLIYNPKKTILLQKMESQGAYVINGSKMLKKQADEAWWIWNKMIKKYEI